MSNTERQHINRWLGINVLAYAAVVGLLFSIVNMVRLAEREAVTTIDDHHR
jgi:hypothetical protein